MNKPVLLCTVGLSPFVVPEAFHYLPDGFSEVHGFTGDNEKIKLDPLFEFFSARPTVNWSVTRLQGFSDLGSQEEHEHFEEGLLRWYLKFVRSEGPLPHVCLAGGFKSMSAGLQKAAHLFGAEAVFHVLCEIARPPDSDLPRHPVSLEEVEEAKDDKRLRFIDLGAEPGWMELRERNTGKYPLQEAGFRPDGSRVARVENPKLVRGIREQLDMLARRASGWEYVSAVPFPHLALLPPPRRAWLEGDLKPESDADWVRELPKVELHCHLGGFATHGALLQDVRDAAEVPPDAWPDVPSLPSGWPLPPEACGLDRYLALGAATGSALLHDPGCLRRQIRRLYEHFLRDNVVYAEVRCSPNNYAGNGHSARKVLETVRNTFQELMEEAAAGSGRYCHVNLIVIVSRKTTGDLSGISRHLSLAVTAAQEYSEPNTCQVAAVDLAGFESPETRARYFQGEFEAAHRCGLSVTAHAGETDDVEGIWQAVFKLGARRLGHALSLRDSPDLFRAVADRGIGVEMCPYANVQICGFAPVNGAQEYPLLDYLRSGVRVTVNTDNIGMSAASLSDNLLLLPRLCPGITRMEILRLQRNGVEAGFATAKERERILERIDRTME